MIIRCILTVLLLATTLTEHVNAWDNDDLEIFDVVEEVDKNFYEFLNVTKDASSTEIRAAYRGLTLVLHPDKNDSPDADVQFRNLVSIYSILKDPGKREKYNDVLTNGLPNWRSAVYYYRHVRKMGLLELSIILFIFISIGQYVVGWASYAEKRYFAEQLLGTKLKKMQKKSVKSSGPGGANGDLMELLAEIPTPSVRDTLPWQISRLFVFIVTNLPYIPQYISQYYSEKKRIRLEQEALEREEREEMERKEEEAAREKEARTQRRRQRVYKPPERIHSDNECLLSAVDEPEAPVFVKAPPVSGGLWTDDDLAELVRLVKKFPGGTAGRWEIIADTMNRNVAEVTHMAAKLKDNCYRVPGQEQSTEEIPGLEISKKVKTKGGRLAASGGAPIVESVWSQAQQEALESALAKYPKGRVTDRWDKIAKCVPDKTKEECMIRFKHLVDIVKKQKSDDALESQPPADATTQADTDYQENVESDK